MKVFISWSGERSLIAAKALRDWLPLLMDHIEPWLSKEDIDPGARWSREIDSELEHTSFGILCLTPENQSAPWIAFEAGAIAKTVSNSRVVPYTLRMGTRDIVSGPLSLFQGVQADKTGTWDLVRSINSAYEGKQLVEDILRIRFEQSWPRLEAELQTIPEKPDAEKPRRKVEDIMEEVLEISRSLQRRMDVLDPTVSLIDRHVASNLISVPSNSTPTAPNFRTKIAAGILEERLKPLYEMGNKSIQTAYMQLRDALKRGELTKSDSVFFNLSNDASRSWIEFTPRSSDKKPEKALKDKP